MPYYTGKGDEGNSGLLGMGRFSKSDPRFEAIGDIDELNSAIGVALHYTHDDMVRSALRSIQNDLFIIGAGLASLPAKNVPRGRLGDGAVDRLEEAIDDMGRRIPETKKFVLPDGCEASAHLHLARSIARRAERRVVAALKKRKMNANLLQYMNRLSSYLFVAALYLNYIEGVKESYPTY